MKSLKSVVIAIAGTTLSAALFAADEQAGTGHDMHAHMQHMQQMQEQMAAIHSEQDAAKRAQLMEQHHEHMREAMRMMEPGDTTGMSMEQRMGAMEERMGMMKAMMEQMMEHQHAGAGDPAPQDEATEHQH